MVTIIRNVALVRKLFFRLNAEKCMEGDKKYEACSSKQVNKENKHETVTETVNL